MEFNKDIFHVKNDSDLRANHYCLISIVKATGFGPEGFTDELTNHRKYKDCFFRLEDTLDSAKKHLEDDGLPF